MTYYSAGPKRKLSPESLRPFAAALLRWRRWVLFAAAMVSALAAVGASRLRIDADLAALLPPDAPSVRALREIVDRTGGAGDLMVLIESPPAGAPGADDAAEAALRYAEALLPRVRALPWVADARFGPDLEFFDKNRLLYLDLEDLRDIEARVDDYVRQKKLRANPLYIDLDDEEEASLDLADLEERYKGSYRRTFQSREHGVLLLVVLPRAASTDIDAARRFHDELSRVVRELPPEPFSPELEVAIGGTFKNRLDELDTVVSDVRAGALWVGIGVALLLTVFFRHPLAIVVIGAPLALSILWTFGAARILVGSLNLVTVFLVVVLLGLAIDFGIHILARFQEERARGGDPAAAIAATLASSGRAALTAALTSAGGFFALAFTSFRGFSDFGVIAGVGLLCAAIAFLTVQPILCAVLHERGLMRPRARADRPRRPILWRRPGLVLAAAAVATGVALYAAPGADFEKDLREIRARAPDSREFNRKMRTVFTRARDPAVVLAPGHAAALAIAARVEEIRDRRGEESPIAEARTVDSLVPNEVEAKLEVIARLRENADEARDVATDEERERLDELWVSLDPEPIRSFRDLPDSLTRPFLGLAGGPEQLVYIYQRHSLMDLENAVAFADALEGLEVGGRHYHAASEPLIYSDLLHLLKREAPLALGLAGSAIVFLLLLDTRSLRGVLFSLTPLGLAAAWTLGAMAILDVKLNLINAAVLPAMLGLGIDGGVHLYRRYLEEGPAGAAPAALRMTAISVAVCIGTSMIGFGGMLPAAHPGLASIGLLAVIGLGASLAASAVVFPAVLLLVRRRRSS